MTWGPELHHFSLKTWCSDSQGQTTEIDISCALNTVFKCRVNGRICQPSKHKVLMSADEGAHPSLCMCSWVLMFADTQGCVWTAKRSEVDIWCLHLSLSSFVFKIRICHWTWDFSIYSDQLPREPRNMFTSFQSALEFQIVEMRFFFCWAFF